MISREQAARWVPVMKAFAAGDTIWRKDEHGTMQPVLQLDMRLHPGDYFIAKRIDMYKPYVSVDQVIVGIIIRRVADGTHTIIANAYHDAKGLHIVLENGETIDPLTLLLDYSFLDGSRLGIKS